jgi:chromosome segregation ATPase
MEAKKQATIDKFNADIEALEAKKKALDEKLSAEGDRYSSEIERFRAKLDDPEPPTPAFRKLKADLAMCIQEEVAAQEEYSKACVEMAENNDRRMKNMIREQEEKYVRMKQEEFLRDQIEREKIEARMERESQEQKKMFEESLNRVGLRKEVVRDGPVDHVQETLDALKNALPPRVPKMYKKAKRQLQMSELTPGSTFTVAELDTITIDYDVYTEQEIELWEKLRHDACCREKVEGYWVEDV